MTTARTDLREVVRAPSNSHRRADIQGLRAIAVLLVVLFHAGIPIPGGFIGVDIFFVISGFVITGMLRREVLATGRVGFRQFYLRRFKRLTPALAAMVAATMVLSVVLLSPFGPQQTAAWTAIGAMLLTANVVISRTTGGYFEAPAEMNPLLNTWSLSVEEQFYLLFPIVLVMAWAVARRVRGLSWSPWLATALLGLVSFAAACLNASGFTGPRTEFLFGFYGPVGRIWEFAAGALLALAARRVAQAPQWLIGTSGPLGVGILAVALWTISEETPFPGPWTLLPVIGSALLLLSGTDQKSMVTRVLSTRPLVQVGDWSYSIYLWHWPLIVFAALLWPRNDMALAGAAVISLVPAVLAYRWIEDPIRRWSPTFKMRLAGLVAITMLVPIGLAAVTLAGAERAWGFGDSLLVAQVREDWDDLTERCLDLTTTLSQPNKAPADGCVWNEEGSGPPIYLVGDSAAAQFLAGVRQAGEDLDSPVRLIAAAHCPLAVAIRTNDVTGATTDEACQQHNAHALEFLGSTEPGVVIIANSNRYWYLDEDRFSLTSDAPPVDMVQSRADLEGGMSTAVQGLVEAGQRVVVILPTYTFIDGSMPSPERLALWQLARPDAPPGVSVATLEPGQQAARQAVRRVAESVGVAAVDLLEWQCPEGWCSAFMGDNPVYADSAHLSQQATASLGRQLRSAIDDALGR